MMFPTSQPNGVDLPRRRLNVKSLNKEFQLFRNNAVQKRRFRSQKVRAEVDGERWHAVLLSLLLLLLSFFCCYAR